MGEIVTFLFNTTVKQKHAIFADISPFKNLRQVALVSDYTEAILILHYINIMVLSK